MICWADQGTTTKMKVHNGMEHRVHSQCYLPVGHQLSGLEVICGRVAYFRMKVKEFLQFEDTYLV